MGERERPWCCPEPRCTPLTSVANGDITHFESGESWWCWGVMAEPVTFIYDGNQHDNEFNSCFYSALKGVVRSQECEDDWRVLRRAYTWLVEWGLDRAREIQAATGGG